MGKFTPAINFECTSSTNSWATLHGVAPNRSVNTSVSEVLSRAIAWAAPAHIFSSATLGRTSNADSPASASGKTCRTHWRRALAKGACAIMKIPLFINLGSEKFQMYLFRHCERSAAIHAAVARHHGLPRRCTPRNDEV